MATRVALVAAAVATGALNVVLLGVLMRCGAVLTLLVRLLWRYTVLFRSQGTVATMGGYHHCIPTGHGIAVVTRHHGLVVIAAAALVSGAVFMAKNWDTTWPVMTTLLKTAVNGIIDASSTC